MSKQVIAIDVDDVLAISVPAWVEYSNKRWGTHLTADDYTEDWAKMWQIDQEEVQKRAVEMREGALLKAFPKFVEAEEILKKLATKYKLVVMTSRGEALRQDTLDWLKEHFGDIFTEVHHTGFYDGQHTDPFNMTKAALCKSVGVDYLIDDHPKHCFSVAEAGMKSLLFGNYSWNREYTAKNVPDGVVRVYNWQEVEAYFSGIKSEQ
jgi:5'(3')-deoxyribonucleotidase